MPGGRGRGKREGGGQKSEAVRLRSEAPTRQGGRHASRQVGTPYLATERLYESIDSSRNLTSKFLPQSHRGHRGKGRSQKVRQETGLGPMFENESSVSAQSIFHAPLVHW